MGFFSRLSLAGRLAAKQRFLNKSLFDPSRINVLEIAGSVGLTSILLYHIVSNQRNHHRTFVEHYQKNRYYFDSSERLLYGLKPDCSFILNNAVGKKKADQFLEQAAVRSADEIADEKLFYSDVIADNIEYMKKHGK